VSSVRGEPSIHKFIFMTTPFRSGSALTTRMLNANSQVCMTTDKLKFFLFCYKPDVPLAERYVEETVSNVAYRLRHRFKLQIDARECLSILETQPLSYASLYATLVSEMHKHHSKPIIGEMESLSWRNIPHFLRMFPDGKAMMIVRDLRDVVVSFKKHTIAPGNDYLIALFNVVDAMDHWLLYQKRYPGRFFGIRYEELKANPEREIRKVCGFLEIDYEPGMLNENCWKEDTGERWRNHQISSFYSEGDYQNPVGRWRRLITQEELFLCEWIGWSQMHAFGMEREGKSTSQEMFNRAIEMLMSSELLRECFKKWCETGYGVQRYPLDPTNPAYWDKDDVVDLSAFENQALEAGGVAE